MDIEYPMKSLEKGNWERKLALLVRVAGMTGLINLFFRSVFKELIYGGYFIALMASFNVIFISILLNISISPYIVLIAFLLPLIIYSYNYYSEIEDDARSNPERAGFLKKKARFYPYIILAYFIFFILLLICFWNTAIIVFMLSLIFFGILYTIFLKGLTQVIPLFKNIFVSFVFASEAVFLPIFFYSLSISWSFILVLLFLWGNIFLNTVFFDLKDSESDREKRLKTMPVMLGNKRTLKFLYIANIFVFIPLVTGVYLHVFPIFALSVLALFFYKLYYLNMARCVDDKGLRAISYILVDGEMFMLPVLLIIGGLAIGIL